MKSFKKSMDKVLKTESNEKYNIENIKVLEKIQEITKIQDKKIIKEIYDFFNEILSNMEEYTSDKYPKSMFFKYNNKIYFELDFKNDKTWCRYTDFWSKFETKFGLKYQEIKKLIECMLGIHLKRKVPPTNDYDYEYQYLKLLGIHLKKVPPTDCGGRLWWSGTKVGNTLKKGSPNRHLLYFSGDGHQDGL